MTPDVYLRKNRPYITNKSFDSRLCEEEAAESIKHCVLLDPEQGYTGELRILESLYGNSGRISDVSVGR